MEPEAVDKDAVVRALRELGVLLRLRGESEYRARAYEVAASRIAQVQGDLGEMVRKGTVTEIPGIGEGIAARIRELVTTGRIQSLEEMKAEFPPGIGELAKVPSITAKRAITLWKTLGVGDLEALEQACLEHKVRGVPGFGEKTEARILDAVQKLRAAPAASERRRLGDAAPRAELLLAELHRTAPVQRGEVGGEVRRACEEVNEVHLVISSQRPGEVFAALEKVPAVARVLKRERHTATVRLFEQDVLVEVRVVPDEEFATALMASTGSSAHWERLRALAEQRGLSLTEAGLFRGGGDSRLDTPDEASVYAELGLELIPPELREDQGELELAARGRLPDLLHIADIQGNVHSHSTWSDGTASLEEMALAAKAQGLKYLTVTEHSPTASYAGGVKLDDLRRLWDEIDALNEKLDGFVLLKGVESDILPDGSLDYPEKILEQLDVVIGSIHARHSMDEAAMTERILRSFDHPHMHILGHMTGRLLQRRDPYALRVQQIFEKAAERGVVIEVNGNPARLDIKAEYVREALKRGVKIVASTDSHSTRELLNLRYSVATARRGGARKADVLNTKSAAAFVKALKSARRGAA